MERGRALAALLDDNSSLYRLPKIAALIMVTDSDTRVSRRIRIAPASYWHPFRYILVLPYSHGREPYLLGGNRDGHAHVESGIPLLVLPDPNQKCQPL